MNKSNHPAKNNNPKIIVVHFVSKQYFDSLILSRSKTSNHSMDSFDSFLPPEPAIRRTDIRNILQKIITFIKIITAL